MIQWQYMYSVAVEYRPFFFSESPHFADWIDQQVHWRSCILKQKDVINLMHLSADISLSFPLLVAPRKIEFRN